MLMPTCLSSSVRSGAILTTRGGGPEGPHRIRSLVPCQQQAGMVWCGVVWQCMFGFSFIYEILCNQQGWCGNAPFYCPFKYDPCKQQGWCGNACLDFPFYEICCPGGIALDCAVHAGPNSTALRHLGALLGNLFQVLNHAHDTLVLRIFAHGTRAVAHFALLLPIVLHIFAHLCHHPNSD